MEYLQKFVFGTVVCDGCARRVDSQSANDEQIHDIDDLLEWKLEDMGWVEQGEDKWLCPDCVAHPENRKHPGEGRVIREKMTTSGLLCDHCGKTFENYEGYSVWEDFSGTKEHARDDDWRELDGRWLCPDCYRTCDAMSDFAFEDVDLEEDNWEEKYCSNCPHKDDCDEIVEREVPEVSDECKTAVKNESRGPRYVVCPYYAPNKIPSLGGKCELPEGKKCPRLETWEKEREEIAKENKKNEEWVKNRDA